MNAPLQATKLFADVLGEQPTIVVRSPGRVNLIGEHTDYNDGFAMPMAIDREVAIALRPSGGADTRVFSAAMEEWIEFPADAPSGTDGWGAYVEGVAHELGLGGDTIAGWTGVVVSSVPQGAGLSSSAALELATARAFTEVSGWPWDPVPMARLAQRAENDWVGMNCGLLDQMASALGKAGHAMTIDFRTMEVEQIPIPDTAAVVILDTITRRELVDGQYNARRSRCESAARKLGLNSLRDGEIADLEDASLTETERSRARHVVSENSRVLAAADAFRSGDLATVGSLMNESHTSLRDDFEVSTHEVDSMVEIAQRLDGCHGARMTGGGFGGSVVALVDSYCAADVAREAVAAYATINGIESLPLIAKPSRGTSLASV